ncbi:hypothetical protein RJZ57_005398 [Blastomyces gilchristii]
MQWEGGLQILYYRPFRYSLAKSGMVALYTQLASSATHLKFLYAFGAVVFFHRVAATLTTIFICTTVSLMWSPTFPVGYIDILHFHYFNADILLAVLPIPILKTLHINRRRKIGLVFYFSIGILTICVTIARQMTNAIALNNPLEFFWHWCAAELCTALEKCISVAAAAAAGARHSQTSTSWSRRIGTARCKTQIISKARSSRQGSNLSNNSEAIIKPEQREQQDRQHQRQQSKTQDGVLRSTEFKITYQKR